ncbi:hypothetical protein ACS0TY_026521 [Phlomoides rotata]
MSILRKLLIVEVIDARNLAPKDGYGTSSPYAVLDFHGQRRKTRTVLRDLNPTWNETIEFHVGKASDVLGDTLELDVFHDKNVGPTTRNNFLGRVRLTSTQFVKKGEEALIYYPLEKKSLITWIQGEIGLKIYFADEVALPPPPPPAEVKSESAPPAEAEKNEPSPPAPPPEQHEKPNEEPPAEASPEIENQADLDSTAAEEEREEVGVRPTTVKNLDDHVMATVSSPVKVNKINGPQPISRVSSVSSFVSDQSLVDVVGSTFDLVEKMHYIFVRVVKARSLPTAGSPVVKMAVSGFQVISKPARRTTYFDWDQTFAFNRDAPDSSSILEVSVWDLAGNDHFLGGVCFDVGEIPLRDPPDSPLAPQWYRLEGGGAHRGDLMLAAWLGTQADESFFDAWKTDTVNGGNVNSKSKVYQSPKLWYLRSTIIEARDISMLKTLKESSFQVKAQLGFQTQKTKSVHHTGSGGAPSWNEDLMFVAAEPFTEHHLVFFLIENRPPKEQVIVGICRVPLMSIERRVDDRNVVSRWVTLEDPNEEKRAQKGRVHLRLCFDGGYHVMEEGAHVCSDYRPTARQLWKPPIGTIELGIIGCKNLIPMKSVKGKGSTDAYAVAKYGSKWVRTRSISDTLNPKWNEQYTWQVYDPSTVLTIGVFDSWEAFESEGRKEQMRPDFRIGKVCLRISTLSTGMAYRSVFPLLLLSQSGLKKMGEIELAVRFARATPTLEFLHVYSQSLLPMMHHLRPLGQQEALRAISVKIVATHLLRSEPPLRPEVVTYMLDPTNSNTFSMRKVRANWLRIINVIAGVVEVFKWVEDTRSWKNPTATLLVHALLVMLVWFPDLIIPTLALYVFGIGAWNYRFRSTTLLPHFDPKLSLAESVDRDELDEEFDVPRPNEIALMRYDKLRVLGARVQTLLGDVATQGERVQALVTWRDPRATGIFVVFCFIVAFVLYLVPSKMVAMAFGFYYLRHPIFRDRMPSPALNFFRRLPSLSDRML